MATGKSNYGVAVGAAAPFAPATPNATERAVKALTAVEAFPHAGVISSSFLKQRNAPKQQEYLEDAVMFNKRADYGTGRHLLNITASSKFPAQTLPFIRKTGRPRRKQHHVCTAAKAFDASSSSRQTHSIIKHRKTTPQDCPSD